MSPARVSGYAGRILRVDLSAGRVSDVSLDEAFLRRWLGGTGVGAKILYDEVPPGVDWNNPGNRLFLGSGPLGGTRIQGTGTFSVVTKGAMTSGATSTQANGFFGAYLRFSGFDGVLIQGAASKLSYIYVHDGQAEIRDASHLAGKGAYETDRQIKRELGYTDRNMSVVAIGPAGENLVRWASVVGDRAHVAGHNGTGAVMGSKRLKAVAVARGRAQVAVKDRAKLSQLAEQLFEAAQKTTTYQWGTLAGYLGAEAGGWLPIRNYSTSIFPDREKLANYTGQYIRGNFAPQLAPCWACRMYHCHHMKIPSGIFAGEEAEEPEYEGLAAWGAAIGPCTVEEATYLADWVDRLGLETNEGGWVVGWAMECYAKGLFTKEDTDGLELTWGNALAAKELLRRIAYRQGKFADMLAEGAKRAAEQVGGEALSYAVYNLKGASPRGHDHRARWFEMFDTIVSNTGTIESHFGLNPRQVGHEPITDPFDWKQVSDTVAYTKGMMHFEDSLGVCRFTVRTDMKALSEAVAAATGWQDFSVDEANTMGLRTVNLMRAFNLRHGIGPQVEYPSARYGSTPVDGPVAGRGVAPHWEDMLNNYYHLMGWDRATGRPLPETLQKLGLDEVVADLWGVEAVPPRA